MKIYEVKERTPQFFAEILNIWESSVRATHLFLSDEQVSQIKEYVPEAVKAVKYLLVAENEAGCIVGFIGTWGLKHIKEQSVMRRATHIHSYI